METGRLYSKQLTSTEGTNLTNSATQSYKHVELPSVIATTAPNLDYVGEDDSSKVVTGAGGGGEGGSPEKAPVRWGYTAPSGSRIEVNDTGGAERIDVVHNSGAGFTIEPDGSIYFVSQSKRGAGLAAPFGDLMMTASGDVIIKGAASLSFQTSGDVNFDVGGAFNLRSNSYKLITTNYNAVIDGGKTENVTNDSSLVIGGIDRKTVAGDSREQVTGKKIFDVGSDMTTRVGGNNRSDVSGTDTNNVKGTKTTSVTGDHTISTSGKSKISASGDNDIYSGGNIKATASGNADIKAGGPVKLDGSSVHASPAIDLALWAEQTPQAALAVSLGGSMGSKPPVQGAGSASAGSVASAEDAKVMDAPDIVDTLTSARKYPNYPGNGVLEGANGTGISTISYDETPGAEDVFNEYSSGNQGNINPSKQVDSYDTLPADPVNRPNNITAVDPNKPTPSQHDLGAKISKYFTLGQLTRARHSHPIPPAQYDSVVKNHILLATNVLDPIKEKFPDIVITSAFRSNSSNHKTGKAIDIVVESRSMTKHAEIARFARDNLPVDQVFLEKNTSGRTHVHLRVSEAGQKATPSVFTCGDPKCQSRTSGIDVSWLGRRAV